MKEWISVEDIVPTMPFQNRYGKFSQSVLAITKTGLMRVCWYRDYRYELETEDETSIIIIDFTHWMNLPDPPAQTHTDR